MQLVKVEKKAALEIIKKNMAQHKQIFNEACEGYKKKAIQLLETRLKDIKESNGRPPRMYFSLQEPADHTRDYERIIKMLEMAIGDEIELDENQFAQYIMDDWGWKRQFLAANAAYSVTADTISKSLALDND